MLLLQSSGIIHPLIPVVPFVQGNNYRAINTHDQTIQLIQNKVEKIANLQLIALYRVDKYIFTFYKIFSKQNNTVREGLNEKKTLSFGHCPNNLTPPP